MSAIEMTKVIAYPAIHIRIGARKVRSLVTVLCERLGVKAIRIVPEVGKRVTKEDLRGRRYHATTREEHDVSSVPYDRAYRTFGEA